MMSAYINYIARDDGIKDPFPFYLQYGQLLLALALHVALLGAICIRGCYPRGNYGDWSSEKEI